jgi:integrase
MGNVGRKATGSVYLSGGAWFARITLPDGSRRSVKLRGDLTPDDKHQAQELAAEMARLVREAPPPATVFDGRLATPRKVVSTGNTVDRYWEAYLKTRYARQLKSAKDDEIRYAKHIKPMFGHLGIDAVGRDDIRQFVYQLDGAVRSQRMAGNTALRIWTVLSKMFDEAVNSKDPTLRVLRDDPTHGVRGPDRAVTASKQYLWPSEFLALMSNEAVPVKFRREVAFAVYTYTRLGETLAIQWGDVDLSNNVIHVQRSVETAYHRGAGTFKTLKTAESTGKLSRRIKLEPNLLPVVARLRHDALLNIRQSETDPERIQKTLNERSVIGSGVGNGSSEMGRSKNLRKFLALTPGVRSELLERTRTSRPITWHDLRATGITWCAVRGDETFKIMHRAGHSSIETTTMYVREAEAMSDLFGEVFPKLPDCLG